MERGERKKHNNNELQNTHKKTGIEKKPAKNKQQWRMKVEESRRRPKETNRARPLACRQIRRQIISVLKATHTEANRLATPQPSPPAPCHSFSPLSASVSCANRPKSCNSSARVGRDQSWHDFRHGSQPPVTYPLPLSLSRSLSVSLQFPGVRLGGLLVRHFCW